MLTVGLSGNVASGKSTVADLWREAGVPVVSADALARDVVAPGSEGLAEVVRAFGAEILDPDGALDRARLREIVFQDRAARRRLEAITHPRIDALRRRWMDARRAEGAALVVAEIPLLFELGLEEAYDATVLVDAPEELRLQRLTELRGLDEAAARRIMRAQMQPELKRTRATFVIDNAGDLEALAGQAASVLDSLRGLASIGREEAGP